MHESSTLSRQAVKKGFQTNWMTKLLAVLALINFALVLFDYSYISCRDFYSHIFPPLTQLYDPVKGIEPHPITESYLEKFNTINKEVSTEGLDLLQAEKLSELRTISDRLIESTSFAAIGKSRVLEKIKHELNARIARILPDRTQQNFASDPFNVFWSSAYLDRAGWQTEIDFFNRKIKPLIATNYYRDLDRFGKFVNYFWLIDLPFVIIFGLDILIRTYFISRRLPHLNWHKALLWRWYDFFLVLPFLRFLRIIPVTIRLYQSNLLYLKPLRKQLNYSFLLGFMDEIAELVSVHAIDRMQESIKTGEVANRLFHPECRSYVRVNSRNEVKAIATRLINISVCNVLPQIKPDLETLLHYAIARTIESTSIYRRLQNVPGFKEFPANLSQQLAKDFTKTVYSSAIKGVEDPVIAKLSNSLLTNFRDVLELELQRKHNLQDIESLLIDLLEEIKINYVEKIAEEGFDKIIEEANLLRQNAAIFRPYS